MNRFNDDFDGYNNRKHRESLSKKSKYEEEDLDELDIVSDDISEAKKLLASILPPNTIWVNPPKGTDAVESLVLMSQGAGNIIANSTFSWWGAALNEKSLVTVAPKKWFKGMQDPKDLYPPDWLLVESSWQA
jgi:hypothetical protein